MSLPDRPRPRSNGDTDHDHDEEWGLSPNGDPAGRGAEGSRDDDFGAAGGDRLLNDQAGEERRRHEPDDRSEGAPQLDPTEAEEAGELETRGAGSIVGHASIRMTAQVYNRVRPRGRIEAAQLIAHITPE